WSRIGRAAPTIRCRPQDDGGGAAQPATKENAVDAIVQLWLPVLLAAVFVFVASSLVHMVFKWHNSDYRALANEDAVRAAIAAGTPPPGLYTLPHCGDMKAMQDPAMQAKYREGPVALLTVMANGMPNMG